MNSKNVYNIYIDDINVYNVSKQNAIKLQYPTGNTIFYAIKKIYIYIFNNNTSKITISYLSQKNPKKKTYCNSLKKKCEFDSNEERQIMEGGR